MHFFKPDWIYNNLQGGFHELQNEPNGVKEKLANDVVVFVKAHLPQDTTQKKTNTERTKL
jgi:hypothetical protein